MTRRYHPIDSDALVEQLVADLRQRAGSLDQPALRVVVDGPPCAQPGRLAEQLGAELRAVGCPSVHVAAESFWRDASLRLEYGRTDLESYVHWLDAAALRREVLDPVGPGGSGRYLPSLRDPVTNRATRAPARLAEPGTVVLVSGALLLGSGLPFDRAVHLAVSAGARARLTPPDEAWTLPAYADYDRDVRPSDIADIAIRWDDPRHPAISA